jgi:hypothetical protein
MKVSRRIASLLLVSGVAAYVAACRSGHEMGPGGVRTTRLTIEIKGGFKYVHSPDQHMLEVAFLSSTHGDCEVKQLGVELTVQDGIIVVPSPAPLTRTFDPDGAVIRFGDNENDPLVVERGDRPATPFHPTRPGRESSWKDLKWVPSIEEFYPDHPLHRDWRSMVNGRVVMTHGQLVASRPSDDAAIKGLFKFRRDSDDTTFTQSMTDRTIYTGRVVGDRVVMTLEHPRRAPERIEVKPVGTSPVKLLLIGMHADAKPRLNLNEVVTHYCSFYELLSSPPPMRERLLPMYIGEPAKPPLGQLSPGAYCSGEFN